MSESFILYTSDYQLIEGLSDEQLGRLIRALYIYARDGEDIELDPVVAMAFAFIKDKMDRNSGKYQARCEKNRQIALEREKRRREARTSTNVNERVQSCTNVNERTRTSTTKHVQHLSDSDSDSVSDSDVSNETDIIIPSKEGESISARPKVDAPSPSHGEIEKTVKAKKTEGRTLKTEADFNAIKNYWNDQLEKTGSTMRRLTIMSEQRRSTVRARLREVGGDVGKIYRAMDIAIASPFMNGDNERGWKGNYDWVMCPKNFIKVLEGNYSDPEARPAKPQAKQPPEQDPGAAARPSLGERYEKAKRRQPAGQQSQDQKFVWIIRQNLEDLRKNPKNKPAIQSLTQFYEQGVLQRLGIDWKPKNSA